MDTDKGEAECNLADIPVSSVLTSVHLWLKIAFI
jgi:hypothetical protein